MPLGCSLFPVDTVNPVATLKVTSIDQIQIFGPYEEPMPLSERIHGYLAPTTLAISLIELLDRLRLASEKETYPWADER
jgi:hypothetical protein